MSSMWILVCLMAVFPATSFGARWKDVSLGVARLDRTVSKADLRLQSVLGLRSPNNVQVQDRGSTFYNTTLLRLQQKYNNIPVYTAMCTVEIDDVSGAYVSASGELLMDIQQDIRSTRPKISAKEALRRAKEGSKFAGRRTRFSNEDVDLLIRVVDGRATLCYRISFFAEQGSVIGRPDCFLNANTGEVIELIDRLETSHLVGIGGNLKTGRIDYGRTQGFDPLLVTRVGDKCSTKNEYVEVFDLNQGRRTRKARIRSFDCNNQLTDEINGGYSAVNDCLHHSTDVFYMFGNYSGVKPVASKLIPLKCYTHYSKNYVNAFFDGRGITIGDGDGRTWYPLSDENIIAHEIGHAFTSAHSNLQYSGQSGGLNEAFSDIIGEGTEFFNKGSNDMIVGREAMSSWGLRSMCNPERDGRSISHVKDYYTGLDVHYSSGILNKVSCNLSQDSDVRSFEEICKLFIHANRFQWKADSTFIHAACGTVRSAKQIGFSVDAVKRAFAGVGITESDISSCL